MVSILTLISMWRRRLITTALIEFESLGLGKLPRPIAAALDDFALLETGWVPAANAAVAHLEAALKAAPKEQRLADAQAIADLAHEGPEAYARISEVL